jgi:hypothetical protein
MWLLTVAALIVSWRAISLLERPCSTSARISLSRADRFDSGCCRSNSGCNPARRAEHCRGDLRRAVQAAFNCVHHGAVELAGAALTPDIAAIAGGGACKNVVVLLVESKSDQLGAGADRFDQSSGSGGVGLAQIDEDDIGLLVGDLCNAAWVQINDIDHHDVVAVAQGRGQAVPYQMKGARDDQPNGLRDFGMRTPNVRATGSSAILVLRLAESHR